VAAWVSQHRIIGPCAPKAYHWFISMRFFLFPHKVSLFRPIGPGWVWDWVWKNSSPHSLQWASVSVRVSVKNLIPTLTPMGQRECESEFEKSHPHSHTTVTVRLQLANLKLHPKHSDKWFTDTGFLLCLLFSHPVFSRYYLPVISTYFLEFSVLTESHSLSPSVP